MKKMWKIFWGLAFILVAVAIVLDALDVFAPFVSAFGEISIWAIIGGGILLCFAVSQLVSGNIGNFFVPLAVIFMIFEENIAHYFGIGDESGNIINNWLLILVAILLGLGFSILFSGIKRRNRHRHAGREWNFGDDKDCIKIKGNIGSSVKYIDCDGFRYEKVENNLGSCTVFFENVDKYVSGGVLSVDNNLGSVVINLPEEWNVISKVDNNLGSLAIPKPKTGGMTLTVIGDNNLGSVTIKMATKNSDAADDTEEQPEE